MAFSYSDKNFTVVGNLCFVHAYATKAKSGPIVIPPALANRMLVNNFRVSFISTNIDDTGITSSSALVKDGIIYISVPKENAYLNFCFPIDSNK